MIYKRLLFRGHGWFDQRPRLVFRRPRLLESEAKAAGFRRPRLVCGILPCDRRSERVLSQVVSI